MIANDYGFVLRLLTLISLFQQLLILNKVDKVPDPLGKYFEIDRERDVKPLEIWLINLKNTVNKDMESLSNPDQRLLEARHLL